MKISINIIMCLILVALFSFIGGFLVGNNINSVQNDNQEVPSVVGTYRYDKWNGDETVVLRINADGSCRYPTGSVGIWTQEGDKLIMDFGEKKTSSGSSSGGGTTINMSRVSGIHTCTVIGDVDGVMLNGFFFEKIS